MVPLLCNLGSRPNYVSTRTFLRWDRLLHPHDFGIPPATSSCKASSPCQPCQPRTSWSRAKLVQRLNVQVKDNFISIYSYQTFLLLHFISMHHHWFIMFILCKYTFILFTGLTHLFLELTIFGYTEHGMLVMVIIVKCTDDKVSGTVDKVYNT